MIDIQKIAREAGLMHTSWRNKNIVEYECGPASIERFAALYREAVVAELVAGSAGPCDYQYVFEYFQKEPFYTADQLAGAVLRERERCAQIAEDFPHDQLGCLDEVAAAIRSGE